MSELSKKLSNINTHKSVEKHQIVRDISSHIEDSDYNIIEVNHDKPWGAYFRLHNDDADSFIEEFFSNLNPDEIRLGNDRLELSPKILLVSPGHKLSWQYHNRRAEMWSFVNDGAYCNSLTDEEGEYFETNAGDVISFVNTERHRLIGRSAMYTLVAEIWQHVDPNDPSDEDDIIRLADDYSR